MGSLEANDLVMSVEAQPSQMHGPSNKFICIIDESIGISDRKLLAITAVSASSYKASHGYPKLEALQLWHCNGKTMGGRQHC